MRWVWTCVLAGCSTAGAPRAAVVPTTELLPVTEVLTPVTLGAGTNAYTRLLGVDPETSSAFVASSNVNRRPLTDDLFWDVVELDLTTGEEKDRFHTTVGTADGGRKREFGHLWPLVDSEADLAWLASVFARINTPMGRGSHELTLSPDRRQVVHHRTGDGSAMGAWLTLRDRDGTQRQRLASPWLAAYLPAFSPDGLRVAYTAHVGDPMVEDPYRLVIEDLATHGQSRFDGVGHAADIRWTAAGQLLVLDDSGREPGCLRVADVRSLQVAPLVCADWATDVKLTLSDDGSHGVLWGRTSDETGVEAVWFSLPDGAVRHRRRLEGGVLDLRQDGMTLVWDGRRDELVVLDPATNREARIEGLYLPGGRSRWVDGRLLVQRRERGTPNLDLVWIDPDAALSTR